MHLQWKEQCSLTETWASCKHVFTLTVRFVGSILSSQNHQTAQTCHKSLVSDWWKPHVGDELHIPEVWSPLKFKVWENWSCVSSTTGCCMRPVKKLQDVVCCVVCVFVCLPPSNTAKKARIRKGALFPTKSYITLPNGAPTATQHTHTENTVYTITDVCRDRDT